MKVNTDSMLLGSWAQPGKDGDSDDATAVSRVRFEDDALGAITPIFVQNRFSTPGRHYGGRLLFDDQGLLWLTIGDRGVSKSRAQDPADHAGSLLRLTPDGDPAPDNPGFDDDAAPEVYSIGHRNPQGRRRERSLLGDGDEITQLFDVQAGPSLAPETRRVFRRKKGPRWALRAPRARRFPSRGAQKSVLLERASAVVSSRKPPAEGAPGTQGRRRCPRSYYTTTTCRRSRRRSGWRWGTRRSTGAPSSSRPCRRARSSTF